MVAASFAAPAFAQDEKSDKPDRAQMKAAMHEQMQAEMKAMDEKLDKLVIDMNAAPTPEARLASAVAVINEMVAQQKKMHERMHSWGGPRHHEHGAGKAEE